MANSILTPTAVTREALRILHQKLNFVGNVNRQYDDSFANSGAKIGSQLKIRLPNEYSVRTGKTLNAQDTSESSVTLTVATQVGVDVNFSSAELTLELDDFSSRVLEPAMARLAAHIENDALSMYKDVYQEVSDVGATVSLAGILNSQRKLNDALAPDGRTLLLSSKSNVDLVTAASTLYNDRSKVGEQYRKGMIGNDFFGYDRVFQNTLLPIHTTGTDDGTGDYLVNQSSVSEGATSLTIDTGAGTWKQGDVFQIANVYRVHPESKVSTGVLQQFVVTAAAGASATSISFSPALYSTGAKQNVNAMPANDAALYKRESDESTAIGNGADYQIDLAFHKDAFAFASADLVLPKGVDFAAREVMDGISMRIVRDYDINNDNLPCRLDVLYGYKTIRPELACRIGFN